VNPVIASGTSDKKKCPCKNTRGVIAQVSLTKSLIQKLSHL
jgi:hypothetical protein